MVPSLDLSALRWEDGQWAVVACTWLAVDTVVAWVADMVEAWAAAVTVAAVAAEQKLNRPKSANTLSTVADN
jgi:hypothetical protein